MIGLIIGSFGVLLLLVAFFLNLSNRISEQSRLYLGMNLVGSAMAAAYAVVTDTIPFVILESAWALAALYGLTRTMKKAPR